MDQFFKYITPLRIIALLCLILAISMIDFSGQKSDPGLGGLITYAFFGTAIAAVILDLLVTVAFKEKKMANFFTQLGIVLILLIWIYWPGLKLKFDVPIEFSDEILIVNEYPKAEKLPLTLFGIGRELKVPSDGVIFTKSKFDFGFTNTYFSEESGIKWRGAFNDSPRFAVFPTNDTIRLSGTTYQIQIIPVRNRSDRKHYTIQPKIPSLKQKIRKAHNDLVF